MSKVLVFESDAPFAEQLKSELQALSHDVTVIDEPNMGLQAAAVDRPDLILLSVELPRMSGFSVCGKLKRDTNLKSIPVIIMSTDATEETFEQHRRLRTHAEVYLKKPISFADLSRHISDYIGPAGGDGPPSSEVLIDEEVDFETDVEIESQPSPMIDAQSSDDGGLSSSGLAEGEISDAAQFAEHAVGALLDDQHSENTIAAPPPSTPPVAPAMGDAPAPDADRLRELQAQISQLTLRAEQAEARASEAENKLRIAPKSEDLHRLQKDLDDTRAKGGATARDFLELREQINRKDKEMLDLRDQVTSRDKELLALRDASLAQERATADLNDRMADVDKQFHELQRTAEAAKADKEQAAKRADDYKKKSERLAQELESAIQERKADKQRHEEERALLQAQEAAAHAEHTQALAALQAEQDSRINAAVEQARQQTSAELAETHGKVLAEKDAELARTQSDALAALARTEQQQLEEIAKIREEAEALRVAAIATREGELRQEHDDTLAALHRANESQVEQLRAECKSLEEKLEEQLVVRKAAEDALTRDLDALKSQNEALKANADATTGSLGQLREALQAALTKLDEITNR